MSPEPKYSPQDVPFIKKGRNRLAGTRMKQLLRAAERAHDDPPPQSGECCGSACDPCVTTLWAEELAVWRERWGEGAVEDAAAALFIERDSSWPWADDLLFMASTVGGLCKDSSSEESTTNSEDDIRAQLIHWTINGEMTMICN
ncbi:hypothetical protein BO70DRAFT_395054 [Aspergillus heteromorphus CBS 117.55]|uniref:Oxidoreductase-like domain-containing protein n=1 Tax=Aspergillus heteromorphus CBS 117.55 TaxID=1448321 RepID=A0A317WI03_9EURO|nr:uncharacterized protein BO70DRAFT_395054 [Aspergillus heteromorphus CBS 117.55]PWY85919.1 hypothetical protein BO70DRAFT_395054 [Aspergillus heteromorphus CBS 117.55]